MREEIYILIDRYQAGELTSEEKQAFEERLKTDSEFAEQVKLYNSLADTLASKFHHEKEELRLRQNLSRIADQELGSGKATKVIKMNWYWAAAASVVLLLGVFFYMRFSSIPSYSDYAQHEPLALIERGSSEQTALQAEEAFNSKHYEQALVSINELLKTDHNNIELQLYKGISLLELNRYKEAEATLSLVRLSNSIHRDKALWYLTLSALKQKDYEHTKKLLQEIPKESEDFDKAQQLLKEL